MGGYDVLSEGQCPDVPQGVSSIVKDKGVAVFSVGKDTFKMYSVTERTP